MGGVVNKTDASAPLRQIRFVNNQGQPPSKRRRINAAYVHPQTPFLTCNTIPHTFLL
jgi:hypothetical protein